MLVMFSWELYIPLWRCITDINRTHYRGKINYLTLRATQHRARAKCSITRYTSLLVEVTVSMVGKKAGCVGTAESKMRRVVQPGEMQVLWPIIS